MNLIRSSSLQPKECVPRDCFSQAWFDLIWMRIRAIWLYLFVFYQEIVIRLSFFLLCFISFHFVVLTFPLIDYGGCLDVCWCLCAILWKLRLISRTQLFEIRTNNSLASYLSICLFRFHSLLSVRPFDCTQHIVFHVCNAATVIIFIISQIMMMSGSVPFFSLLSFILLSTSSVFLFILLVLLLFTLRFYRFISSCLYAYTV